MSRACKSSFTKNPQCTISYFLVKVLDVCELISSVSNFIVYLVSGK
jgi:hypothetical protein